jgi:hypothetical protein
MLQNLGGACKKRCDIKVGILIDSKAPPISTDVAIKNCLLLKE